MIYITYRDLKVQNEEIDYLLLQQRRGGGNFQRWNLTSLKIMNLTCHNFED